MGNYRELTDELNSILQELQDGELSLDDAIKRYEEGMKLVGKIETELKTAENKIAKIKSSHGLAK